MKTLLALCFVLFSSFAFASGKLSFKQKYQGEEAKKYSIGLSIYEKILPFVYFSSWNGGGAEMSTGADPWLKTDNAVYFRVSRFALGVGGSVKYLPNVHEYSNEWYVNATADLW